MAGRLILLLGGARGGKSRYAETWAQEHGRRVLFVATAQAFDDEMRQRIARHRADRPANWTTVEAPLDAAAAIRGALAGHDTVLIDCITLLTRPKASPAAMKATISRSSFTKNRRTI